MAEKKEEETQEEDASELRFGKGICFICNTILFLLVWEQHFWELRKVCTWKLCFSKVEPPLMK